MPFGYPVLLELAGRRCVVVGGLPVREGKVEGLLAGGATEVVVVAPEPSQPVMIPPAYPADDLDVPAYLRKRNDVM